MLGMRKVYIFGVLGLVAAGFAGCTVESDGNNNNGSGGATGSGTSTGTATSSSTVVASSSASGMTGGDWVGLACSDDAVCQKQDMAGRCAKPSDDEPIMAVSDQSVGGPAGGYCTKDCIEAADCPTGAICVTSQNGGGVCMLECGYGVPDLEFLDDEHPSDKCHGRDDQMCLPLQSASVCYPICGSDDECGGRKCDLRSGICTDTPAKADGKPLGAKCTPDDDMTMADENDCAGICLTFVDENDMPSSTMCSAYCSRGGSLQTTKNCGGPEKGVCVFGPAVNGTPSANGDIGFCSGACDSHDVCNYEGGLFCFDIGLLDILNKGYCFGATDCPNGTECDVDEVCTQTKYGPVCLEADINDPTKTLIPLGDAAANTGTGGAGGAMGTGGAGGAMGTGGAGGAMGTGGSGGA